jgi:hypothetical protein
MAKQIFTMEHVLNAKSENIIWELISTPGGLSKWFADQIEQNENIFTFFWGLPWNVHETRQAKIISQKKNKYIRFAWEDETDESVYWELKIETFDLTGDYSLIITDFAEKEEMEDQKEIWINSLNTLRRMSGL